MTMLAELGLLALLLLFTLLVWEVIVRLSEPKNLPPGPRFSPLIKLLPPRKLPFVMVTEMGKKYEGIFTIKMGSENTVVIDNVAVAREALLQKGHDFSGRPLLEITRLVVDGKNIVLGDYGPAWKLQRKIAHSALRVYGSARGALEEKITEEVRYMMERFERTDGAPVNPQNNINLAVLNVICAMVFGSRYDLEDPDFYDIIELNSKISRLFSSGQSLQLFPWLKYLPTKLMREVKDCTSFRDSLCKKKIQEHKETFDSDNIRDLTDAVIKVTKDAEAEGSEVKKLLTEKHMILTLMDIFQAGLDTTATTILWVIAYLVNYPDVQEKVQQEIDDVIGRDLLPALRDKGDLPYFRALVTETLRFTSIFPFLAPHKTTVDTTLRGYNIPKDTIVIFNTWAMHHDPDAWQNPSEFNPSRFINTKGQFVYPGDRSFLPFGAGARVCLGESLAKTELFLFLSHLLHQFTFKRCPDSPPPSLENQIGVLIYPKPYKMCVCKRD